MSTDTTAAVLRRQGGPLSLETITVADPRPDEILVRTVASGVCHTDLGIIAGATAEQLPIVLGHEGAGVVDAVGRSVRGVEPGDHVVLSYAYCGSCDTCRRGITVHCRDFVALNFGGARGDGTSAYRAGDELVHGHFFGQSSWSGQVITTQRNVVVVPPEVPLELLAPLGCGVQTGAGAVLNTLRPGPGSSLAVFAAGSVGLSAVMAAKVAGCRTVIAVDPQASRRELALELGATLALDPTNQNVAEAIVRETGGGTDYSVDCIGLPAVTRQAVECLTQPGVCATVGFQGMNNEITLDQAHLLFGRSLVGVIEGDANPHEFIPRLIKLYQDGNLPLDRIVTTFPIGAVEDAIAAAHNGKAVKAVVTFPEPVR